MAYITVYYSVLYGQEQCSESLLLIEVISQLVQLANAQVKECGMNSIFCYIVYHMTIILFIIYCYIV